MRLNKTTSHALRVLVACARAGGELRKVADLSEALDLTEQNVFKMVHLLSRAGLVAAERGRYGGVRLARPAEEIRVGDVVVAMEQMPHSDDDAPAGPVGHGALFDDAFEAFLAVLNQSTVADMAKSRRSTAADQRDAKASAPARKRRANALVPAVDLGGSHRRPRRSRAAQNSEP